jgi:hypothetical protein
MIFASLKGLAVQPHILFYRYLKIPSGHSLGFHLRVLYTAKSEASRYLAEDTTKSEVKVNGLNPILQNAVARE